MSAEEYAKHIVTIMRLDDPHGTIQSMLITAFNFGQAQGLKEGREVLDRTIEQLQQQPRVS